MKPDRYTLANGVNFDDGQAQEAWALLEQHPTFRRWWCCLMDSYTEAHDQCRPDQTHDPADGGCYAECGWYDVTRVDPGLVRAIDRDTETASWLPEVDTFIDRGGVARPRRREDTE